VSHNFESTVFRGTRIFHEAVLPEPRPTTYSPAAGMCAILPRSRNCPCFRMNVCRFNNLAVCGGRRVLSLAGTKPHTAEAPRAYRVRVNRLQQERSVGADHRLLSIVRCCGPPGQRSPGLTRWNGASLPGVAAQRGSAIGIFGLCRLGQRLLAVSFPGGVGTNTQIFRFSQERFVRGGGETGAKWVYRRLTQ